MFSVFLPDPADVSGEATSRTAGRTSGAHVGPIEPASYLAEYVMKVLKSISVDTVRVIYKERGPFPSKDVFSTKSDKKELIAMLVSLTQDKAFFTLGQSRSVLIIPFEGMQFNLVVEDAMRIPLDPVLEIMDSTEILRDYPDAYEAFGIEALFPGERPALSQ